MSCFIRRGEEEISLTPQEVVILNTLLQAPHNTCTHEELYREVWGFRSKPQGRAVHYALRRLRFKLERTPDEPKYLKTIRGRGYRLDNVILVEPSATTKPSSTTVALPPLPRYPTSFVGRQSELEILGQEIANEPCITLVGAAGLGKTRLAIELGRSLSDQGSLVAFCAVTSEGDFCAQVARSLGMERTPHETPNALGSWLDERCDLLIVDTAETVFPALGAILTDWLDTLLRCRLLVTARRPLQLNAEWVYPVRRLSPAAASTMFRDRVIRAGGKDVAVDQLVPRLEGHPLILELAAPKTALLGQDAMLSVLDRSGNVLHTIDPTKPPRHQHMTTLIQSTVDELEDAERDLLTRCTLCPAGFTLEMLEALAGEEAYLRLASLLSAGLVAPLQDATPVRWHLPLYVRAAVAPPTPEQAHEATACIAAHFAQSTSPFEATFTNPTPPTVSQQDLPTLRQVFDWCQGQPDTQQTLLVGWVLSRVLRYIGLGAQALETLSTLLTLAKHDSDQAGWLVLAWADLARSRYTSGRVLQALVPVAEGHQSIPIRIRAYMYASEAALLGGEVEDCHRFAQAGIDLATLHNHPKLAAQSIMRSTYASISHGDYANAKTRIERYDQVMRHDPSPRQQLERLLIDGAIHRGLGRLDLAMAQIQEALAIAKSLQHPRDITLCTGNVAIMRFESGTAQLDDLDPQTLHLQMEEQGLVIQQVLFRVMQGQFALALGQTELAQSCADQALNQCRLQLVQPALPRALLLASQCALTRTCPEEALSYLVRLQLEMHHLNLKWQRTLARVLHNLAAAQQGIPLPHPMAPLDEELLSEPSPLYRARLCWHRSQVAKALDDLDNQAEWIRVARQARQALQGGCPLDLRHL